MADSIARKLVVAQNGAVARASARAQYLPCEPSLTVGLLPRIPSREFMFALRAQCGRDVRAPSLYKRKIKLFLQDARVAVDVH